MRPDALWARRTFLLELKFCANSLCQMIDVPARRQSQVASRAVAGIFAVRSGGLAAELPFRMPQPLEVSIERKLASTAH